MNYFAYGSNLGVPRLRERCPSVAAGKRAKLSGWQVTFNKVSDDKSGKANIERIASGCVWGALFVISSEDLSGLRAAEGYPSHYSERPVIVDCEGQEIEATT